MPLTSQQLATLKADILANPDLDSQPNNGDGNFEISRLYALPSSPAFYAYRRSISSAEIFDKIDFAKLTPADAPDGTQTWANRSLCCQGKQFNLQLILDRSTIDATKSQTRSTMQDALTNIPSGAGGATVSGWVPVRDLLYEVANRGEKLFATGTGTTGSPATRVVYGTISTQDIETARNLP